MTDGFEKKAEIREQIEYDILCQQYDRMQLDELVEIMLEVAMNRSPTVKIGRDAEYPTGFVQQRFEKITSMHIEKVMDGIRENTTRVWNTKAYLMAALFNSVSTIDNHYAMLVNHDFHAAPKGRHFSCPILGELTGLRFTKPQAVEPSTASRTVAFVVFIIPHIAEWLIIRIAVINYGLRDFIKS